MIIQKANAKAIHIAKSQKSPTARPKFVNKYGFSTAERTIEREKASCQHTLILHSALCCKYSVYVY